VNESNKCLSDLVRLEIGEASEAAEIVLALYATPLRLLEGEQRERGRACVPSAILKLADGNNIFRNRISKSLTVD
jgi:hypothetical protein